MRYLKTLESAAITLKIHLEHLTGCTPCATTAKSVRNRALLRPTKCYDAEQRFQAFTADSRGECYMAGGGANPCQALARGSRDRICGDMG